MEYVADTFLAGEKYNHDKTREYMNKKRLFFTGGSGKAGKHMIPYLPDQGHRVMNVDLVPLNYPGWIISKLILPIIEQH